MKTNEYKLIEYVDDDGFVIANITMCKDQIVGLKIEEDYLTNRDEFNSLIQFLSGIKHLEWQHRTEEEDTNEYFKHTDYTNVDTFCGISDISARF